MGLLNCCLHVSCHYYGIECLSVCVCVCVSVCCEYVVVFGICSFISLYLFAHLPSPYCHAYAYYYERLWKYHTHREFLSIFNLRHSVYLVTYNIYIGTFPEMSRTHARAILFPDVPGSSTQSVTPKRTKWHQEKSFQWRVSIWLFYEKGFDSIKSSLELV